MARNSTWVVVSVATSLLASGCTSDQFYEYRAHTDKVTEGAGNASAANRAIQTVDPWPVYSQKTDVNMDGKRALVAVRRYETNTSLKPKDSGADMSASNGAAKD
jgi:hypothetical protein